MKENEQEIIEKWEKNRIFRVEIDRLKRKSTVFASPIYVNQLGFQNANAYKYLYADSFQRYLRMNDTNVLYSVAFNDLANTSFLESKRKNNCLDDSLANIYKNELLKLGVGLDITKAFNENSDFYIEYLQRTFIKLYELGYIKRKTKMVETDGKKIYQDFEGVGLNKENASVFVLNIKDVRDEAIAIIENLNLDNDTKNKLLKIFKPCEVINIPLLTSNNNNLYIHLKEIWMLGGISFIVLNPDLIDYQMYVSDDEEIVISDKLSFCGTYAINPLTGREIPLFLSTKYDEKVHLGIPDVNLEDYDLCESEGLEYLPIVEDGYVINSDFISGLGVGEANKILEESFINEGVATKGIIYEENEIIISSLDEYGCLIPLLIDDDKIYPLNDNLPITFSKKFRYQIPNSDSIEEIGTLINGSLNRLFCNGLLPMGMIIYDENVLNTDLFNADSLKEITSFSKYDYFIIDDDVYANLAMPIIFYCLISKIVKINNPLEISNILIFKDIVDKNGNEIKASNLNLIDFNSLLDKYSLDAIRLYYYSHNYLDEFRFDPLELDYFQNQVYLLRRIFNAPFIENSYDLEMPLYEFDKHMEELFLNNQLALAIAYIFNFQKKYLQNHKWSYRQAFTFLKWISLFTPCIAEEVFKDVFKENHLLLEEDFK